MWYFTVAFTLLALFHLSAGGHGGSPTCSYGDICQRTVTINEPCDRWPPCRDVTINVPCLKQEACTPFYDEWSGCSASCGGGTRTRFGRCCAARCTRIISDTESCNTAGCAGWTAPQGK